MPLPDFELLVTPHPLSKSTKYMSARFQICGEFFKIEFHCASQPASNFWAPSIFLSWLPEYWDHRYVPAPPGIFISVLSKNWSKELPPDTWLPGVKWMQTVCLHILFHLILSGWVGLKDTWATEKLFCKSGSLTGWSLIIYLSRMWFLMVSFQRQACEKHGDITVFCVQLLGFLL